MTQDCFKQEVRIGSILFKPSNDIQLVVAKGRTGHTASSIPIPYRLNPGNLEKIVAKHNFDLTGTGILKAYNGAVYDIGKYNYNRIVETRDYVCLPDKALLNKPEIYNNLKTIRDALGIQEPISNIRVLI